MTYCHSDPIDDLLVLRAQDGDGRSMEALVSRWQRRLWKYARRLTGSNDAAWDITQQSWLAIIRGLGRLHDPANFRAWAYRIVAHKAMDHLRSTASARGTAAPAAIEPGPADQEDRVVLRDLLARLAPDKRALLVLCHVEGLTEREVAFVLGIPRGTVKSRLHAARGELRKLWQQEAGETDDERRGDPQDHRRRR